MPVRPQRRHDVAKYCSKACRSAAKADLHRELELILVRELVNAKDGVSISPRAVARARFGPDAERQLESVRRAARRLAHRGVVLITQRGKRVHPSDFSGPIEIIPGPGFTEKVRT